jgi:hypothetical protein
MASQINYGSINEAYPVAGQDNNSQGFRDNFNLIKLGLETASGEITTLQANTAKVNTDNNFFGNLLTNAEIRQLNHSVASLGSIITSTNVDVRDADYFHGTIAPPGSPITITFSNWGADGVARRIWIKLRSDGTSQQFNFGTTGGGVILSNTTFPFTTNPNSGERYLFELHSIDGGDEVYANYLGAFV